MGSTSTLVENFITHNGDFDFYELNGAFSNGSMTVRGSFLLSY